MEVQAARRARTRTDCYSEDGLVARALRLVVRTQIRTAQRGSIHIPRYSTMRVRQGLVELDRCRSDLSLHLLADCLLRGIGELRTQVPAAARVVAPGMTLTWRASKVSPLVITAHRMRAFLLASATTAFCQPDRSRSAAAHLEIGSLRLWAVITADFAPWISSVRT